MKTEDYFVVIKTEAYLFCAYIRISSFFRRKFSPNDFIQEILGYWQK